MNNTPCTEKGFKVGDKFEVLRDSVGFRIGQVVTLFRDDGSDCPLFAGENSMHTLCSGAPGAYLSLSKGVTKIEEFKVGDLVTISNVSCNVLQRRYDVNQVCELIEEHDREGGCWLAQFSYSKGLDNDRSSNNQFYVGGGNCDITAVPPIPEPEQVEMRRVVTTITMTQDVPLDEFDPQYANIEAMQEFVEDIIHEDPDLDLVISVTKVSVELVDEA